MALEHKNRNLCYFFVVEKNYIMSIIFNFFVKQLTLVFVYTIQSNMLERSLGIGGYFGQCDWIPDVHNLNIHL